MAQVTRKVMCAALATGALILASAASAAAMEGGTFEKVGALPGATGGPGTVAAALPGGRALVAGGRVAIGGPCSCQALQGAVIFDPTTGNFSSVGPMGTARAWGMAAPLPGGRVLVAGGFSGSGTPIRASAEIFDVATNSFSSAGIGSMTVPRYGAVAAPLPGGRVLIAGGNGPNALSSAEIFDPATGNFTPTGSMSGPRTAAAASPLPDGRVIVVGGTNAAGVYAGVEIFDPATNSFTPGPSGLPVAVAATPAAPLADGRVLITGRGRTAATFDPATNAFSTQGLGRMQRTRYSASAAPVAGGGVLVAGGESGFGDEAGIEGTRVEPAEVFIPCCSNDFTFGVNRKTLEVAVKAPGLVEVVPGASAGGAVTAAKRKSKKRKNKGPAALLAPAKATGGPGTIAIGLSLNRAAKRKLARKGRVRVPAKISFSPNGGIPKSESAVLLLTQAKKKSHRKKKRHR